jgi:Cu(I)/Ag(I) efflux system membrane protein CusA/SilA
MKPIAAPIIGGVITSTIHVLVITPVIFAMVKERALKRGRLLKAQVDRLKTEGY